MSLTFGEFLIWIIVGGLCGSTIAMLATRNKQGFGRFRNLILGMAGSLVGGTFFNWTNLDLGLGELSISFEDLIAGFVGSIAVLLATWCIGRYRNRKKP